MTGDPDEGEEILAFGSMRRPISISRRVRRLLAGGGIVALAAIAGVAIALRGAHSGEAGTGTPTTIQQQDAEAQFQGPWSLDLSPGTVMHIARPGSGGSVPTRVAATRLRPATLTVNP